MWKPGQPTVPSELVPFSLIRSRAIDGWKLSGGEVVHLSEYGEHIIHTHFLETLLIRAVTRGLPLKKRLQCRLKRMVPSYTAPQVKLLQYTPLPMRLELEWVATRRESFEPHTMMVPDDFELGLYGSSGMHVSIWCHSAL